MSRITILSEHLANQIAAGEVVERPASVAKELLENSIDAGATQIDIQVEGDGTRQIRIVDNGEGMDSDDVLLCLERHATSKLANGSDDATRLNSIRTLGFRGEAIPSIASVAKMSITSKTEKSPLGTRVDISYGKIIKIHETGSYRGTIMEVRNLFGNLPARRKFLKSRRTELTHIEEAIKNYALAYPRLGITYTVDGKTILDLPANTDTGETRFRRILGRNSAPPLIEIIGRNEQHSCTLAGWLLPPDEPAAASGSRLRLFVNSRAVRDRMLTHAVHEGLANFIMKGRGAGGILFIDLPPAAVDVNVHPTKLEIRLRNGQAIHALVAGAVKQAMAAHQDQLRFSLFGKPDKSSSTLPPRPPTRTSHSTGSHSRGMSPSQTTITGSSYATPAMREPASAYAELVSPQNSAAPLPSPIPDTTISDTAAADYAMPDAQALESGSLIPIGQLHNLYILCQSSEGLVVIDQHAAHERIHFESLKKQFSENQVASQSLLFPAMMELTPEELATLRLHHEELSKLGFNVEEFGGESVVIKAAPAPLAHLSAEDLLREMLGQYQGASNRPQDGTRLDGILASMACKAAIKAGRSLGPEEIEELLTQMQASNAFSHCPHGRPTFKEFSLADVERWFHRG